MAQRERRNPGQGSGQSRYPGTFQLVFREAAAALGWQVRRWKSDMVECVDAEGKEHMVGVENLYRRARMEDRDHWPELIASFLDSVRSAELIDHMPEKLGDAADHLLVRLGRPFSSMPDGTRLWTGPLEGTGLGINLVIDHPNSMAYVTEQMVADSGRTGDAWVEQALENLLKQTPADCFQPIHEDHGILLCNVADAYDSSRAMLLPRLLPDAGAEGYFAVLPGRDELLVLPVSAEGLAEVHLLKVLAEKNFKSAPYAISDEVHWIHEGVWRPFHIDIRSNEITIEPPPEFLEVLQKISPETLKDEEDEVGGTP